MTGLTSAFSAPPPWLNPTSDCTISEMRRVCSMICRLVMRASLSDVSVSRFCARQAMPVTGLPISWATPAASRPMEASRSLWASSDSSDCSVVRSSTRMTTPPDCSTPKGYSIAALCRLKERDRPSSLASTLCRCGSSESTHLRIRSDQGCGNRLMVLPQAWPRLIPEILLIA